MEPNGGTAGSSTLLARLRNDPCLSYCGFLGNGFYVEDDHGSLPDARTISLILRHESEFPFKMREEIRAATAADPPLPSRRFCKRVRCCLGRLLLCAPRNPGAGAATTWNGLDSEVDTEDEVETAIRLFPSVLLLRKDHFYGKSLLGRMSWSPIFWVATCIKALPFVPLVMELAVDLGLVMRLFEDSFSLFCTERLVTNRVLIKYRNNESDEEFDRRLDQVSLSVMIRLKEKGSLDQRDNYRAAAAALALGPDRAAKRLRFLIDLDPSVLRGFDSGSIEIGDERPNLLMKMFQEKKSLDAMKSLPILQMLIEVGVSKYPEEIGFLFHTRGSECLTIFPEGERKKDSAFRKACDFFGKEIVVNTVNRIISKNTDGKPRLLRAMFVAASTKPEISVDGLHFLCRKDPTSLISFLQKDQKVVSRKRKLKKR
mmetsp:Transcript_21467/g.51193  ORF Transcript_21467/g.51193 Transcript_21467/m.51193 type:complete len:428 (-) Transcript_21467:171-1454(-)|eukprot:CAMPEP_0197179078 /NCGR_PEP_ID=MMETSP1423-20130617/4143_1 /TAXON_ID=476441 /ORGANISM="Pseudo-nitzschia heimii, Strain UNC1101" /LENGTH=427 /DNA_ID=CAMNT_0042628933 /DNA_START=247 /DNA_END=1530 /DNA_ORIENTATION=+